LTDMLPSDQLAALQTGDLDGGFIGIKPAKSIKGLAFADWNQEPLLLVLPEKHPLTRIRKLQWRHLQGLPWVMISRTESPAARQQFSKIVESQGISAQIVQESARVAAVLTMVAAGIGVTMCPQSIKHLIPSGVVFRQLPQPEPIIHYVFAYRTGKVSPALETFLSLLRTIAQ